MATNKPTEYTAIYPATPIFNIGNNKYDLIENLKKFVESFAKSLKEALNGNKMVLIRIAHVGESGEGFMRNIYSAMPEAVFVPIQDEPDPNAQGFYRCAEYIGAGVFRPRCADKNEVLHADPLVFAKRENAIIESITYGENDVETKLLWYHFIEWKRLDTSKIDAYVLFNSTLRIADEECRDLQILHGGFKAIMWNPLGCFKDSAPPNYCLQFPQVNVHRSKILERVHVNPHWIWGDYEGEDVNKYSYILMILGDKENWFFSLPIAPPPLYFLAQSKKEKIVLSRNMIRARLGRNEDEVRKRVSEVLETYGLNDLPEDVRKGLYEFLNSYYSEETSNLVVGFKNRVEEILRGNYEQYKSETDARVWSTVKLLEYFLAMPQCKIEEYEYKRKKYIKYGNYSYLDFLINKKWHEDCINNSSNEERYRCSIAWVFGLSLLVLLDSYKKFVGGSKH